MVKPDFPIKLAQSAALMAPKMVGKSDPRHQKREKLVKELFTWEFRKKRKKVLEEIVTRVGEIDRIIKKAAPEWPISRINKVDLAVLRLAVYELTKKTKKAPPKVIIDEAIELAKTFGSEKSPKFVNGALGAILRDVSH